MTWFESRSCERTRFLAALAPDQTLSEAEERMLTRHLDRCPACRAFAVSVAEFTGELRAAPLVERETRARDAVFAGPKRSRSVVRRRGAFRPPRSVLRLTLVAASAAMVAVVSTTAVLDSRSSGAFTRTSPVVIVVDTQGDNELAALRQLRNVSLARRVEARLNSERSYTFPTAKPGPA